jgi:hypothetical protein
MAAPEAPPINAPFAVWSGLPLGVVQPASKPPSPITVTALTMMAFMIALWIDGQ